MGRTLGCSISFPEEESVDMGPHCGVAERLGQNVGRILFGFNEVESENA